VRSEEVWLDLLSGQPEKESMSSLAAAPSGTFGYGGDGYPGTDPVTAAGHLPSGIAVDPSGNLYVTDCLNSKIRKVPAGTGLSTRRLEAAALAQALAD